MQDVQLRPFQTYFILSANTPLSKKHVEALVAEVPAILNRNVDEPENSCHILRRSRVRNVDEEVLVWMTYRKTPKVRWAIGPDAPRDTEHHILILMAHRKTLAVVTSDKTLAGGFGQAIQDPRFKQWSQLSRISPNKLVNALISGAAKTLWLSGIHRSVAIKPDSKVLIGHDLEASLDALAQLPRAP